MEIKSFGVIGADKWVMVLLKLLQQAAWKLF